MSQVSNISEYLKCPTSEFISNIQNHGMSQISKNRDNQKKLNGRGYLKYAILGKTPNIQCQRISEISKIVVCRKNQTTEFISNVQHRECLKYANIIKKSQITNIIGYHKYPTSENISNIINQRLSRTSNIEIVLKMQNQS